MCAGSAMMRRFVFKFESLADAQAHTQNKSVSVNWRNHASITALRQCGFGRLGSTTRIHAVTFDSSSSTKVRQGRTVGVLGLARVKQPKNTRATCARTD